MLSSSLIALLAASSLVNGLPTWYKRGIPGVAVIPGLNALTGTLGNTSGLDALANVPGAANPQANAAGGRGRKTKANQAGGVAGQRQKGTKKKGNKQANGNADVGLGANTTSVAGAVETGSVNGTLIGNATVTGDVGAGAGATTVTVTVTVTETSGAANTTAAGDAGGSSTAASGSTSASLSATVTSPPVASSTSISDVASGAQTLDITSLDNALPTFPPIQTPVSPGQGGGGGQDQAQAASVDPLDAEEAD